MTFPLADEILRRLMEAEGAPLSGQRLASHLGVTRAAVWKGIEALRGQGYPIDSRPSRGYLLASGPCGVRPGEIAARLRTRVLGRPARHLFTVDSTNREAERWAREGAGEGALVVAEAQSAGRGRLGRTWLDLPGKSLLMSLVLRPPLRPAEAPLLTYVAALSLAESLATWVPAEALEIKWPNDVLAGGRKLAGILLEMRAEAHAVEHVILGVGINVGGRRDDLPEPVRGLATTVATESPAAPDRLAVLCRFLEGFEEAYGAFLSGGFAAVRPRWGAWFRLADRPVRIKTTAGASEGIARGLDEAGALLLESADGAVTRIYAGDLESATTRAP